MADTFKQARAEKITQGQETTEQIEGLAEKSERAELNRLLGLPPRQFYPAWRISIEQVRLATDALRNGDKYGAEKIMYPRQSKEAVKDGLFLVFKAAAKAIKDEQIDEEFVEQEQGELVAA